MFYKSDDFSLQRRNFIRAAGSMGILMASPAFAFDLFKDIDKANKILQIAGGASKIMSSSTELDYKSEFAIGESIALEGLRRYGLAVDDAGLQKYVNLVGGSVVRNSSRSNISFYFTVIHSKLYNAFACPGGIIFVSSALFEGMKDESELACVLAHEVGHVCHKHALGSIRRAKFFEGVGEITAATMKKGKKEEFREMIGSLQTVLFDKGLDKNMEFEADLTGMEIAYNTGYDPAGLIRVLNMLRSRQTSAHKGGSWFSTHPPISDRLARCHGKLRAYPDSTSMARVKPRFEKHRRKLTLKG
jgi:beta-barrel assembly-enhancing protease